MASGDYRGLFARKIDGHLDVGQYIHHGAAKGLYLLFQGAGDLLGRKLKAPLRLGIDQVYDGLGLGEVDPSIDIGSESEFTRFGDPGAFPDHDTEYF